MRRAFFLFAFAAGGDLQAGARPREGGARTFSPENDVWPNPLPRRSRGGFEDLEHIFEEVWSEEKQKIYPKYKI